MPCSLYCARHATAGFSDVPRRRSCVELTSLNYACMMPDLSSRLCGRCRMWAFWSVVAPSLKVPPEYASYVEAVGTTYPTSSKPDALVSRDDILRRIYRNYYEGTPYDLSVIPPPLLTLQHPCEFAHQLAPLPPGPALHCTALHCTALRCTALHCTALHCLSSH